MVVKVYYYGRRHRTKALGEYDTATRKMTVYKGSVVSESIARFKRTEEIKRLRDQYTNSDGILLEDVTFDSPSTATVFVSGYSVNGLMAWHVEKKKSLKAALQNIYNYSL